MTDRDHAANRVMLLLGQAGLAAGVAGCAALALAVAPQLCLLAGAGLAYHGLRRRPMAPGDSCGSARFADAEDLLQAGAFDGGPGLLVGQVAPPTLREAMRLVRRAAGAAAGDHVRPPVAGQVAGGDMEPAAVGRRAGEEVVQLGAVAAVVGADARQPARPGRGDQVGPAVAVDVPGRDADAAGHVAAQRDGAHQGAVAAAEDAQQALAAAVAADDQVGLAVGVDISRGDEDAVALRRRERLEAAQPARPTYCQLRRKIRSRSSASAAGSVYQAAGKGMPRSRSSANRALS